MVKREIKNQADLLEHEMNMQSQAQNEYETEELFLKLKIEEFMSTFWSLISKNNLYKLICFCTKKLIFNRYWN